MTGQWAITETAERFIAECVTEAGIGSGDVPSEMWAFEGRIEKPGEPPTLLPGHYGLGWVRQSDLRGFATIPSVRFGRIVFQPSDADAASSRRIIDFDGDAFIVR